jgi:hypothetical protein
MNLKQLTVAGAMLGAGAFGVATSAYALDIDPTYQPQWTTNQVSALSASDVETLTGYIGDGLTSVYKSEFDGGGESGAAAPYYTTTFSLDSENEPTGAMIVWDGPLWILCPTCYLVVKDGSLGDPTTYVFDLLNWDGQETINLSGFWEDAPGAISYLEIFNEGGGTIVPEADTYAMLLAGLGLVGFAARRRLRKQV